MNNRALTLALVMAGIAVFFVQSYVSSIEEEAKKKFGTEILVIVARRDIKEMETLNETSLELKLIPKRFLEPAAISLEKKEQDKETSKALKGLAGVVAIVPIRKGEQITYNKITEPSMRTGLAPQIAPGRRAISIPVNETSGVSKLIKPGDRVDLIAVLEAGGGKENKIAKTVLQDVIILSIGRYVTNNVARIIESDGSGGKERVRPLSQDFSYNSVTLEVEPSQAQALALVMANGDNALTLSLRNNDDSERLSFPATVMADVLGAEMSRVKGAQLKR
ncbi:MAG: Flp pilus assembly protein CpaB [Bdellovibrionia bacterium]